MKNTTPLNLGGFTGGYATAVNARGEAVGISDVGDFDETVYHGFYWSKSTGIIDLATLNDWSEAFAINRAGTVVGWSYRNTFDSLTDASDGPNALVCSR